jgi:Mannosyltransferase (PIG-V)
MAFPSRGRAAVNPNQDTVPLTTTRAAFGSRGRLAARDISIAGSLGFPVFVGGIHFLIVQVTAFLAWRYGTPTSSSGPFDKSIETPMSGFIGDLVTPLRMWDGLWYKLTAEEGYAFSDYNAAFWPLFPWMMRYGHRLTGWDTETVGWIIANVTFIGALILLYWLVSLDFDTRVAKRTLWAIALFPTSLFFTAVYTESLFLMLAVAALLGARRGNWWIAGIAGALAALTRSYGVLLLLPFAVLFYQQYGLAVRRWFPNAIPAALPVLGPAIFAWYLDRVQNNWRQFIDAQTAWWRTDASPIETFRCAVNGCRLPLTIYPTDRTEMKPIQPADWGWIRAAIDNPNWSFITSESFRLRVANSDTLELVSTILFLVIALIGLRMLPLYLSAFLIPGLVIPLFNPSIVHPLMSMPRFGLTLFPIFIVIALLVRNRRVGIPLAVASTCLLVIFTIQFSQWYWVS